MYRLLIILLSLMLSCQKQENMISDFEGEDFGRWEVSGTAFGNKPASDELQGQDSITGFSGNKFASSRFGGLDATGSLTSPKFRIRHGYINFLISGGNLPDQVNVQLIVNGKEVRKGYANHQEQLFWFTWDVKDLIGSSAVIIVNDHHTGEWGHISVDHFEQSDTRRSMDELYRPQFHITAQWNHINDPNGLVYYDGEYHVFHQHSPFGRKHGTKYWGHLVSKDLIHWKHLPWALSPEDGGGCPTFSGSAVVDSKNSSGFQTGDELPIVLIWTGFRCGQYIAFSNDRGRTFRSWEGNPVIPTRDDDRDPMVRWHEPSQKWVMALPEQQRGILGFHTSDDLKTWTHVSDIEGVGDCPDIYKLPVDGDTEYEKWILYGGEGVYKFGSFDGTTFEAEEGTHPFWMGNQYATQTFSNTPDGRKIMLVWVVDNVEPHGMPYSQMLSFPTEVKIRTFPEGIRVVASPIKEIELLHQTKHHWSDETISPGDNLLGELKGDLFEIRAEFEIGTASEFGFHIRGDHTVCYNAKTKQALLMGDVTTNSNWDMPPVDKRIQMQILVDRSIIEAFYDEGRAWLMSTFFTDKSIRPLEIFSTGGETKLISLDIYELKSSWDRPL